MNAMPLCSSDRLYWDVHLVSSAASTGAGNESGTPPPGKEAVTSGDILQTLYASGDGSEQWGLILSTYDNNFAH